VTATKSSEENAHGYPSPNYAWYVVSLSMVLYVLSFMDRQIIAVLVEPIKADLGLSDVQISIVGGFAFVLFYATVGVFVGRLADSLNRPLLIGVGVFIWSLTTAMCGYATKFSHLLILRMGVGLGESALLPSTLSLLSNYFPPKRLATPTSVFMLGAPIGIGLSFIAGGYLYRFAQEVMSKPESKEYMIIGGMAPWQLVLLTLGLIGILLSTLLFTIKEPRNSKQRAAGKKANLISASKAASVSEVKQYCLSNWRAIGGLYIGMSFISLASYSQGFWDITFLSRTYDWDPATGGMSYGMVQLVAGLLGAIVGGVFADRLARRNLAGSSVAMVIFGSGIAIPFSAMYPMMPSPTLALAAVSIAIFGNTMAFACTASAMQRLFPTTMIGLATGIYFFISNAVGIGLGPTSVAMITEYMFQDPDKIRYSLLIVGCGARVIGFLMILGNFRYYDRLVAELEGLGYTKLGRRRSAVQSGDVIPEQSS